MGLRHLLLIFSTACWCWASGDAGPARGGHGMISCADVSATEEEDSSGAPPYRECRLDYYVQVEVGDVGLNEDWLPSRNASFSGPFGQGVLFAFNVTKGPARRSTLLGVLRGYTFQSAYRSGESNLIEVEFVSYDDGFYKGTIQIQGQVLPQLTNEVAVIGGTGSFRGARGYGLIHRESFQGNYRLFRHHLRFL